MQPITILPLTGIPEIQPECDLIGILADALAKCAPCRGDILVVTHKIVSKAYGYVRPLESVTPGKQAEQVAALTGKDPRQVQVILDCSEKIYAYDNGILLANRPDGWVCANAGVDASNAGGKDRMILLPPDCDALARQLSQTLGARFSLPLPVIICDTHGRALRSGAVGVSVGSFGLAPVRRYRGQPDRDGRILQHTEEAVADEIASAATLLMGQGNEGVPAALLRGFACEPAETDSAELRRSEERRVYKPMNAGIVLELHD